MSDQWQPISTAPREWVLLWTDDGCKLGFYMKSEERWHIDGGVSPNPSHWMPLPDPPVIDGGLK